MLQQALSWEASFFCSVCLCYFQTSKSFTERNSKILIIEGQQMNPSVHLSCYSYYFTNLNNNEQFEKQYSYNIRHNYGKEGKRVNYSPFSCMKIITTNAPQSSQEHHGWYFDDLRTILFTFKYGVLLQHNR